jgi:hypothetical protein
VPVRVPSTATSRRATTIVPGAVVVVATGVTVVSRGGGRR